ncbi:MAG: CotH kinase family protein [Planctomycetota bacterium]
MKRLLLLLLVSTAPAAAAQDFYDPDVLRTVDLQFQDEDWWTLLQQNYVSQTNILADMTVEGVVYPDVGVRIRGNTSFTALPPGAEKVSLNVTVDFVNEDQEVMDQSTLNFNNAFLDPTFCREVVYHNILNRWIPNGRANHIVLTLNGENWGVYANVQQYGKKVLGDFFDDNDGLRIKCANNPVGPGLQYMGTNPAAYSIYEIKDDGGLLDPVAEIIAVCDAVDNTAPADWQIADQVFAVDPSIWTVVLENLFSDDDGYVSKGCDFVAYRNPIDGRMHLHQTDGNETWTNENWQADQGFTAGNKPFLSNLLTNSFLRGRYMAHLREVLDAELDWAVLEPEFNARRALIDAAVQADPKKLYSYDDFVDNFTTTVSVGGGGPFTLGVVGLQEYVDQRRALLLADPEVAAIPPTITGVTAGPDQPGVPIFVTATVTAPDPLFAVEVWYQGDPSAPFERLSMADDGLSGDGAAGDGVYGVELPFVGVGGQKVAYYVSAASQAPFFPQSYSPIRAENAPLLLIFQGGAVPSDIVINEFLASNDTVIADEAGDFEDYVELYNKGASTVDLSGMFMSDSFAEPTEWEIPAGTTLGPGEAILFWADEDLDEGPLHADFKLSKGGEEIGLWDTDGTTLLDSIIFGAQDDDVSTGRLDDGEDLMVTFPVPTPNALNDGGCGLRAYDQLDPFGHTLDLDAAGTGAVGTIVTLTASGLEPGSLAYLGFASAPAHIPLGSGTVLLLGGSVSIVPLLADGLGEITLPLGIPNSPLLVGLDVYCQFAGTDAASLVAGSNALHLSICP